MAYLDSAGLKLLTLAPAVYVDQVEAEEPGWIASQLDFWSNWIDSRLAKRYAVPFASPTPTVVKGWLARVVTLQLYLKRGVDATDGQYASIVDQDREARDEIKEAANAVEGLFELPLKQDAPGVNGVSKGFVQGYAEPTAYDWTDKQRDDANAFGTFTR